MLKNESIYIIIILTISFMGCKEEEDNTGENQINILGSWVLKETTLEKCDSVALIGSQTSVCNSQNCTTYQFRVDTIVANLDTITVNSFGIDVLENGSLRGESGVYTIFNDRLSLCEEDEEELICSDFKIVIEENMLTMTFNNPANGCNEVRLLERVATDG